MPSTYSARDLVRVPGLLSLSRLPLAVAFGFTVVSQPPLALAFLALAGLSDVLDGWYARRYGQATRTGAVLDAIVDKVFVLAVAVTMLVAERLDPIQVVLLGTRDLGELVTGARLFVAGPSAMARSHPPNVFGKVTTALQYATVSAAVLRAEDVTTVLALATGVMGILAAIVYGLRELPSTRGTPKAPPAP